MISQQNIYDSINKLGIKKNSVVHIQSDLSKIGPIKGLKNKLDYLNFYYDILKDVVGPNGTISVYTFNLSYGRENKPHDVTLTPSQGCAFSEHIRLMSSSFRSIHPLASITANGYLSYDITRKDKHISGFGSTSPWAKLFHNKAYFLSLGLGINDAGGTSFIHYLESLYGVHYKYDKLFTVPVFENNVELDEIFTCSVSYKNIGLKYDTKEYKKFLINKGFATNIKIGKGNIFLTDSKCLLPSINELSQNRYVFLKKKPNFINNQIPIV